MTPNADRFSWNHAPVDCAPEEVGFDPSRMRRLEEIFQGLVVQGKAQGAAYCLARHGKVFADRAMGVRSPEGSLPLLPGTWRNVASVTKVLTSLGVAKLVEDGRLLMEFPVCKVLTEFDTPRLRGITLAHLLTHTSGLMPDPGSDGEPEPDYAGVWGILDRPDWVEHIASLPATTAPGEAWRYSSLGFSILGEVIRRTTGEPYARWMSREVLEPAGLRDSFWDTSGKSLDDIASVSEANRRQIAGRPDMLEHSRLAMGGLFSTCRDLVRLGGLFLAGGSLDGVRVVGRRTVEALTRIHVEVPAPHWGDKFPDWKYGLGLEPARHPLVKPGSVWGHEGSGRCAMWFDRETGLAMSWILPTTLDWDPDFGWTPRAVALSGVV
ncbi:MAG TPA: serine hydrolase domain-containing protein [Fibrobacteria bacterium]|nr:serine hydrolase domain-containing protein [Fibrobacteria bacterium]HOX53227.1 serine hydrolase domain-containing protein [Fibrobacteria bacterium]